MAGHVSAKDISYPSPPLSRSSIDSDESLRALEISEGPVTENALDYHNDIYHYSRHPGRSYSVSGFQFENDLLPLSLSEASQSLGVPGHISKTVGIFKGIALIVGLQIGSGIFSSPGVIVANTNSVGASLVVWVLGVILAWTGASSFAELGCAIPLNGGAQAYLNHAFNPLLAYLFAWTAISALKPGSNAIIALVFGEYVTRLFYHATGNMTPADELPTWSIKLTASAAVFVVTFLGIATPNLSTRAAVVFTALKVLSLVAIAVLGLVWLARGKVSDSFSAPAFEGSSSNPSSYALALYSALWAVDGKLRRSMALVMGLFIAVNLSYFVLLDKETVARSNTVALDFGRALFGTVGGVIFTIMVALSCFGALNGSFFTSARLIYVAGREHYLPSIFGRLHSSRGTPLNALCLQATLTLLFIIVGGGFRSLINFATVASWGFYFLTVLGLVVLRFKEPYLDRPYKTFLVTPLIFCSVALFLLCMPVVAAPLEAMAALAFILSGVPVYYITQHRNTRNSSLAAGGMSGFFGSLADRFRRRRADGWVPVSTHADGEETIEMEQHHPRT